MKPQIQKEKIKKNKTNPNALTSVLKTLEKVKETQKQKQIAENEKNKKEVAVKKKRKDELESMKNLVANAISSKPKNLIKPIGISEIDMLKKHISNFWTPPIGAAGAENLIVDIFMEFNKEGYVLKAEWVNRGMNSNNTFYKAAANADVIFSDKVISLNDKVNKKKKIKDFLNFKINSKLMSLSKKAILLHCLPRGSEITDEVFYGKKSKVWQQALNRVHVQKSILLYCLNKLR